MSKIRIPTDDDYRNYDGAHCALLWEKYDENWKCPGCSRTKREILKWSYLKNEKKRGWLALLARHHCHSEITIQDMVSESGRFPHTIICGQCNAADGMAKRKLGLPSNFSFSPSDIRKFVIPTPHGSHKIDYEKAKIVYKRCSKLSKNR